MITAEDLIQENQESNAMRLGTVAALFAHGTAKVQFDGEDSPSEKEYAYLSYYTPQIEDRVLLSKFGKTYIILGALSYAVAPPIIDEGNNYLFDEEEVVMTQGLDVTGATKLKSGLVVTGNATASGNITATGSLGGASATITNQLEAGSLKTTGTLESGNATITGTLSTTNSITGVGITTTNFLRHQGTSLAFFNANLQSKRNVSYNGQSDSTRIANIASALQAYGLINLV